MRLTRVHNSGDNKNNKSREKETGDIECKKIPYCVDVRVCVCVCQHQMLFFSLDPVARARAMAEGERSMDK